MMRVLRQPQYQPMKLEHQVLVLYAVTEGYMLDVDVEKVSEFEEEYILFVENNYPHIVEQLEKEKDLTPEIEEAIKESLVEFKKTK